MRTPWALRGALLHNLCAAGQHGQEMFSFFGLERHFVAIAICESFCSSTRVVKSTGFLDVWDVSRPLKHP